MILDSQLQRGDREVLYRFGIKIYFQITRDHCEGRFGAVVGVRKGGGMEDTMVNVYARNVVAEQKKFWDELIEMRKTIYGTLDNRR